ncbi:helix-turn-helix transcriptional regulator [Clostridium sp. MB40-C1]|uniref:helix-turn-helix transcriptional regulator n=1 Tax=Clostridium sp. MB40-C1 TaxID=3070996 RepID=UPI0027E123D8|nr:helix-turn-helix transcriptional regulator [Clostridium sp. MB40-C1]WMJ81987.1 helix-turn-helix transcriptional regulator [Clostridium sp. MB40-C1]
MALKNRLLEIRLAKGYKFQKDFAEFLGVSSWLYNRWEKNAVQPSTEALLDISLKLNIKMEDIVYKVPTEE